MNRYLKNTALLIIFAGLISLASAQGVDFEYMQQQATVDQGGITGIEFGLFPSKSAGGESSLELIVDKNRDGEYSSDEVIAKRNVDIKNYTELEVDVRNVSLDVGTYDYTARLQNGSGYYYYPYGDGSLTVESNDEFGPEIERIELEIETEGPFKVGEKFQVLVSTESEEVVSFETYMKYDDSKVDLVGVEAVSSSLFAERSPTSSPGKDILIGQSETPLDSPEMAMVTFQAEHSGYSQITTNNSEIGTQLDTFTGVGEDEVTVSINSSDSSDTKVEKITAEVSATTAVKIEYDESESKEFKIDETGEQAIIREVGERTGLGKQRVEKLIDIEREEIEVDIRAEIGDKTIVTIRSSINEKLNQKLNLSFTNRGEIISEITSRTQLQVDTVKENIEFEDLPLEELKKETLIEKIEELEGNRTEELLEENRELEEELRKEEQQNKKLKRENERLRERLGKTNSSYDPGNETESEKGQRENSSRPSEEVAPRPDRNESADSNQSEQQELSNEEIGVLQRIASIFS